MKKSFLVIYAAPVALLLMAGGLGTPSASADPQRAARLSDTVKGVFTYDRNAPAGTIYASLQQRAERLCAFPGAQRSYMRKYEDACVASVVASGVRRIGRADLAQLHTREIHTNARG